MRSVLSREPWADRRVGPGCRKGIEGSAGVPTDASGGGLRAHMGSSVMEGSGVYDEPTVQQGRLVIADHGCRGQNLLNPLGVARYRIRARPEVGTAAIWVGHTDPCRLPDHCFSHASTGDRRAVRAAAAAEDWERFLRLGAAELRPGLRDRRHDARIRTGRSRLDGTHRGGARTPRRRITRAASSRRRAPTYILKPGERAGLPITLADSTIRVTPRPGLRGPAGPPRPTGVHARRDRRLPRMVRARAVVHARRRPPNAPGSEPPSPTEGRPSRGRRSESASERSPKRLRPTPCPRARAAAPRRCAAPRADAR